MKPNLLIRKYTEPGKYLSGGYFKLPMAASEAITREDIADGRCFCKNWLIAACRIQVRK
jgi:hypothetical protein